MKILACIFKQIWDLALPYQDKRNDEGHAESVTSFALELLDHCITANPFIVVPAAILHDTGYSQMSEERRMISYTGVGTSEEYAARLEHQIYALGVALEILKKTNYPAVYWGDIIVIISQHDTRKGSIGLEEQVMRDADKLWRYTRQGLGRATANLHWSTDQIWDQLKHLEEQINHEGFFFTDKAREIAMREISKLYDSVE